MEVKFFVGNFVGIKILSSNILEEQISITQKIWGLKSKYGKYFGGLKLVLVIMGMKSKGKFYFKYCLLFPPQRKSLR